VKLSSLGDVLHMLPALTDASVALPGITFDWAVEEAFAAIPAWHRSVQQVIPVALRRWRKTPLRSLTGPEWRAMRQKLRQRDYDKVIDAQGLIKRAVITGMARGHRVGLDRHSAREGVAALAYQSPIAVPRDMHAVQRTRTLFARALGYELPDTVPDFGLADQFSGQTGHDVWLLHGTARKEKTWPEERWQALARELGAAGYRVLLPWGDEIEQARAQSIAAVLGDVGKAEVLPRLALGDLAGRLASARAAVAVDTGLGHLAAALDIPCISLYGPTDPALIGACGARQIHLRANPAGPAEMAAITVESVTDALQPLIGKGQLPAAQAL